MENMRETCKEKEKGNEIQDGKWPKMKEKCQNQPKTFFKKFRKTHVTSWKDKKDAWTAECDLWGPGFFFSFFFHFWFFLPQLLHDFSWSICQLCPRHTSDDLLLEVWCRWVSGLFLGNVLCCCRSVSTSMVSLCTTNSPTSWLRQALSQLREVAMQRIVEKRVELAES